MTKEIQIPKMLSIAQTAKVIGLTKHYIRQLVLQGKVKYVRSGVKYLLNMDSLINYLNNGDDATVSDSKSSRKINVKGDYYDKTRI